MPAVGPAYAPGPGDSKASRRSCSIFFYEGWLGVSPTVLNLARVLDRSGYDVAVLATRTPFPGPRENGSHTKVLLLRRVGETRPGVLLQRVLRRARLGSLMPLLELVSFAAQAAKMRRPTGGRSAGAGLSVGIDAYGAITAWVRQRLFHVPYAYLSLELGSSLGGSHAARLIGRLERRAYRNASFVIVQDEERLQALASYLNYQHPKVTFLPNSPLVSTAKTEVVPTGNWLRQRCGIDEEAFPYIVLQAGMVDDAVYSKELARTFTGVGAGCALVYHERLKRDDADPYLVRLREINSVNLFLSLDPLPMEEVDRVFASATIGVAFYRTIDPNFSLISMASGKLGYYTKHGKPVLVCGSESLGRFVADREIGMVVQDPTSASELQAAIDRILGDFARYSANSRACFEADFDFERTSRATLEAFDAIAPSGSHSPDRQSVADARRGETGDQPARAAAGQSAGLPPAITPGRDR